MKVPLGLQPRVLAAAVWTGLAFLTAGLLGRASAAAVSVSLPPAGAILISAVALAASLVAWWADCSVRRQAGGDGSVVSGLAAVIGPMLLGLILVGDSATAVAVVLLLSFSAAAGVVWTSATGAVSFGVAQPAESGDVVHGSAARTASEVDVADVPPAVVGPRADENADDAIAPEILQQMTRRCEQGIDVLECLFRVEFAAGQREAGVHIPIWPAFAEVPEVECEPLDESEVEATAASVHTYGVRIDVRLSAACEDSETVLIGVQMSSRVESDRKAVSDAA